MSQNAAPVTPVEGEALGPRTFHLTRADLVAYAEASGDHNPIHQDESVALAVGLPGVIAHGMLTLGLAARAVAEWFPGAEVLEFGSKFTHPVVVPSEGTADVEFSAVVKKVESDEAGTVVALLLTATHAGTKVLGMPKALLRLS